MRHPRWVLVATLVLVVGGCGGTAAGPSNSPTLKPTPSIAPSPSATEEATPSASPDGSGALAIDALGSVVTDDLRVRSKPEVSDTSEMLEPLLDFGRQVYIVAGPVAGSGYDWYQVQPIAKPIELVELPFGWVAASDKDGTPWLVGDAPECDFAPATAVDFAAIRPILGLACYGNEELSFAARLVQPEATCGVDIGWTIDPDWLAGTCPQPQFLFAMPDENEFLDIVLDPDTDVTGLAPGVEPKDWLDVIVTGHFDDEAANACQGVSNEEPVPLEPAEIVLRCRTTFAVTKVEPDGFLP